MRVGVVILPEHRWSDGAGIWRHAEALGFDHAWTYDHIAWRDLRDSPWFAAVPTLTAAALATSTIRLGTLVASPNFRHPVPFARELITLDDVSNGRLTLGIGAGGEGWDATILGQDPWPRAERMERFAEFVDLLDRAVREPAVSSEGRYYSANETRSAPGCVQQPRFPFAVAATGPKSMRVAAKHADIWVTNGDRNYEGTPLDAAAGAKVVAAQRRLLEETCAEIGRDATAVDSLVVTGIRLDSGLASRQQWEDMLGAYETAGVTDIVVHWPRDAEPFKGDLAEFERITSR